MFLCVFGHLAVNCLRIFIKMISFESTVCPPLCDFSRALHNDWQGYLIDKSEKIHLISVAGVCVVTLNFLGSFDVCVLCLSLRYLRGFDQLLPSCTLKFSLFSSCFAKQYMQFYCHLPFYVICLGPCIILHCSIYYYTHTYTPFQAL